MKLWPLILYVPGIVALGSVLWGTYRAHRQFPKSARFKKSHPSPKARAENLFLPGVSILKPLKGVDADLEKNLESFFHLQVPYEIIFSVADAQDPAISIASNLIKKFPEITARLIVGANTSGLNPKINNLLESARRAIYDWVLISDSNVYAPPDLLESLFKPALDDPGVGMVTGAVGGFQACNLSSRLEAMILNSYYARGMLLAFDFGQPCVVGKAMLFKLSVAERFGGISTLSPFLAEDYQAGQAMRQLGLKIALMRQPVIQILGPLSFQTFWRRHVRWGLLRKTQAPLLFFTEWILSSAISGLLFAIANTSFGFQFLPSLFVYFLMWMCADALLARTLGAHWNWKSPYDWVLRELLHLPIWVAVCFKKTVLWRGERLRIGSGGLLEPNITL